MADNTQKTKIQFLDLTKQPPRSPRQRLNGFVVLGRTIDKCRAMLNNKIGEYHYNCPVDNILFSFKGITADLLTEQVKAGKTDQEIADWLVATGTARTSQQIKAWSDDLESQRYGENPQKKSWFIPECERLGLNPSTSTLFDYLIEDDKQSFKLDSKK